MEAKPSIEDLSPSIPAVETAPHERWISESGVVYYRKTDDLANHLEENEIYQSIDSDMRVFCALIGKSNCFAIPYHSSRHYDRQQLRGIFNKLKKEEGLIRRKGLSVRSCTTGEETTFYNKLYRMPWGKLDDYYDQIGEEQQTGKIAIFVPVERGDICKRLKENSYDSSLARIEYQKKVKGHEFFVLTIQTESDEEARVEWRLLTQYLAIALGITKKETQDAAIQNV